MKREKFERKEAERTGFPLDEFRRQFAVTPCDCGKKKCDGWKVRYRFRAERRRLESTSLS
jgi:hypothetical protein